MQKKKMIRINKRERERERESSWWESRPLKGNWLTFMMRIAAFKRQQTQRSRRRSRRLQIQLEATDGVIASRTKSSRVTTTLQRNHFDLDLDLSSHQIKLQSWNETANSPDQIKQLIKTHTKILKNSIYK